MEEPFPQFLRSHGRGIKCLRLWWWLRSRISLTVMSTVRGVQGRDFWRRRVQVSTKCICFTLHPSRWSRYNYEYRCCCHGKYRIYHGQSWFHSFNWFCTISSENIFPNVCIYLLFISCIISILHQHFVERRELKVQKIKRRLYIYRD